MPSVCFYFQVHQPYRIKRYKIFDIGNDRLYFNDDSETNLNNKKVLQKVAKKCYLPTNKVLMDLLEKHPEFRVSFSLSGVFIEQLEEYAPEVLSSFQDLVKVGGKRVEILSETYYHSLAFLYSKAEFRHQVELHKKKIYKVFRRKPVVFRNTELIYNDDLASEVEKMGYAGIIAEGADHVLGWRSPNFIYKPTGTKKIKLLLKNYKLSDDIAFRFSEESWSEYPLTAEKFAHWVSAVEREHGEVINLFMDYETFGEHQWEDKGIFKFLQKLPEEILKNPNNDFVTPSEAIKKYKPVGEISSPYFMSWADVERDLSAWLSNPMQHDAMHQVFSLRKEIESKGDDNLAKDWRRLHTSDHFYYMCTKWFADGDVHKYFNPYESPYDAYISFMNVLKDIKIRLNEGDVLKKKKNAKKKK